ncbi:MAG: 6-pyruvoyl-tetrahydropterin synthase-related protein, partial [Anaerolineae bacterium]|nr:6-pyruvoyl-tetrahydropterin synthase-related protein [Anaerolineae bacterium]
MRQRLAALAPVVVVVGLALIAASPFLTRPGLPHHTDAELHVYRAAELGHALRGGAWYPRWAPDFYFGYGYPIFNYYAPLTYYLANLFALLPGLDIVGGVKAVFVSGFLIAALGAYLLGRRLFDPAAGIVAAASFTFAPYVVFIDPHARGALAEYFAMCLIPGAFYALHCLMEDGGKAALLGGVCFPAAVVLSHNLLGLVTGGLLAGYWVWEVLFSQRGRARAGWGLLAFALAASLTAFFWLPFLLERDAIKLNVIGPGHFDFRNHFLTLGELLAPSHVMDMGATGPRYRFNLGLAQWLLALLPLVIVPVRLLREECWRMSWQELRAPVQTGYFLIAGLVLIFLMLPVSVWVWERVPGMPYLQFPWRLMGPANLMLAVLGAAGSALYSPYRRPLLTLVLAAILVLSLPVLYPPSWSPDFGGTRPQDIIAWEQRSQALGTTSTGDFLPVKAALGPLHPMPSLIESYDTGLVDKVNRATLPEGARVEILEHGPLHDRIFIVTPRNFLLRLYTFYFPGWRAYIDGQEAEIQIAGPEGFITVWVTRGKHEVLVRFEDTPPRTAGWLISAAGAGILCLALVVTPGAARDAAVPDQDHRTYLLAGGVLLLFWVLKVAIVDPRDNWLRYTSPPGQAWAAQHQQWANFGDQIELLGYDLPRRQVRAGEPVPVVLYWHALRPLEVNYQSFVHLARPLHILWGQEDHLNPGDLPTTRWPLDKYVWDEYHVRVLPGTPPGEYLLNVGLYSMAGGYRLPRYDESGQAVGDSALIASVEVRRPRRYPAPGELDMAHRMMALIPEAGVTLLGYTESAGQVALPGVWQVTLFWRAARDAPSAHTRTLVLVDRMGQKVLHISGVPADGALSLIHI